jgi:hypothetical protein
MKNWKHYAVLGLVGSLVAVGWSTSTRADVIETNALSDYPISLYRAHELSLDAFGMGSIGQRTIRHLTGRSVVDDGRVGAGAGVNYFFTRHLGFGWEAYSQNTRGTFVDNGSMNLIGRLPLGESGFAPYALGGGGYQFDVKQGIAQAGGGIEFRFNEHVGIFVDARYVWAEKTDNFGVGRFGVRWAF